MNAEQRYAPVAETLRAARLNPHSVAALPPVSREQAATIARLIRHKFAMRDWRKLRDEVRRMWLSKLPTCSSNSSKGLGRLVHDMSHDIFAEWYPNKRPHDPLHAKYETGIAAFVATSKRVAAVLAPKPPPEPPRKLTATEKRSRKLLATRASIARWESKAKRATNALRKLRARERGLERAMYEHDLRPLTVNGKPPRSTCPKTGTTKKCNDQMCCY
jgi:hypothetical protein